MNLNNSNNNLGIRIKKLRILTQPKNVPNPFLSIKYKTPTINQMPFLLKNTSDNSTNMTTIPFKKKLLYLLKGNKSLKSFANISKYLFDEQNESDIKNNYEMRNKFYIRQREGLKSESTSENILNMISDTPSSLLHINLNNKSSLGNKYHNYNEENTKNNEGHYFKRKILFRNRSENSLLSNKIKKGKKINILDILNKTKENKEKKYSSFIIPKLNNISIKKNYKEQIGINEYNYEKNNRFNYKYRKLKQKMKDIGDKNYGIFKKICRKRAIKNAELFSKSLIDIQNDNEPYEPIYEKESENNIRHKLYFHNNNLDRIIKVEKTNKKGFNEDDIINNVINVKKFNENTEFIIKKLKHTRAPRSIKLNNFSRSTIIKYNILHRSNFGLPC
jgi:hypothetical protein